MINTRTCDIMVIGLGAMGSAALYQLSQRAGSRKIIGLDKFAPPHPFGSTHGESRITRQAIGEGRVYTPLSLRSYEIWRQLEHDTGEKCLTVTGGLIMASPSGYQLHGRNNFLEETVLAAVRYGITKHEILLAHDIRRRFPQFFLQGDEEAYYEYEAGILHPENCIRANLKRALESNPNVQARTGNEIIGIKPRGDSVMVFADNRIYEAGQVILTVGPWLKHLLAKRYHGLFGIYRQVMYWFHPRESIVPYEVGNFPVFIWQFDGGFIYGFPAIGGRDGGVKVASEQVAVQTDPDLVNREVSKEETLAMHKNFIASRLPGLSPNCARTATCLYTVTSDSNFVIDRHPEFPQVIIASACSGHGFKHSAAVGQILAELALDGKSSFDISQFSINRF